jgi:hypothetical protein
MADEDEKEVSVKFITSLDREYRVPEAPMVRSRWLVKRQTSELYGSARVARHHFMKAWHRRFPC